MSVAPKPVGGGDRVGDVWTGLLERNVAFHAGRTDAAFARFQRPLEPSFVRAVCGSDVQTVGRANDPLEIRPLRPLDRRHRHLGRGRQVNAPGGHAFSYSRHARTF
jgi:hypothetical protein